jgi:plastocyanin
MVQYFLRILCKRLILFAIVTVLFFVVQGCGGIDPIPISKEVELPPYKIVSKKFYESLKTASIIVNVHNDNLSNEQIETLLKIGYNEAFELSRRLSCVNVYLTLDPERVASQGIIVAEFAKLVKYKGEREQILIQDRDYIKARPTEKEIEVYVDINEAFDVQKVPADDKENSDRVIAEVGEKYGLTFDEAGNVYMKVDFYDNAPQLYRENYMNSKWKDPDLISAELKLNRNQTENDQLSFKKTDSISGNIKPPKTTEELFGVISPSQEIIHSKMVFFPNTKSYYCILALSEERKGEYISTYINQICVCRYDIELQRWLAVWKSDFFEGDSPWDKLFVTGPDKSILLCASYFYQGATGSMTSIIFTLEENSNVTVRQSDCLGHGSVELSGSSIIVTEEELGQYRYSLQGGKLVTEKIKRDSMAPSNAVKAHFIIQGNTIVPQSSSTITIRVGQTVAFVPADEKTAIEFNEKRTISIYTDAWSGPPLTVCEANRLKRENSYTFVSVGTFHFYLDYWSENEDIISSNNPKPTFTIIVKP